MPNTEEEKKKNKSRVRYSGGARLIGGREMIRLP